MGFLSSKPATNITTGTFFETLIPVLGQFATRRIAFGVLRDAIILYNQSNKGNFNTSAELIAAYPEGQPGWFAIVQETGPTVWTWSVALSVWQDTEQPGLVTSVNGLTGEIVLSADDIAFTSVQGLTSEIVSAALDELYLYVQSQVSGASGGAFINDTRVGTITTASTGEQTFQFLDINDAVIPFLSDKYILIIDDYNGLGYQRISQTAIGFTINLLTPGTFGYHAIYKQAAESLINALAIEYDNTASGLSANNLQDAIDEIAADTGAATHIKTFDSGDLTAGILIITHNLGELLPTTIIVYDDDNKEVNKTNYIYKGLTTSTGQIEFFLPITNTWTAKIKL